MNAKIAPQAKSFADGSSDLTRESTRPIRALNRGLDVLTELNRVERAAINTMASAVGLPRTTTYRILETLRLAGYVERDTHDDCYRPTIMVRALSDGFDDEASSRTSPSRCSPRSARKSSGPWPWPRPSGQP